LEGGHLLPYLGTPEDHGVEPVGSLRWLVLFPHLRPWHQFASQTGTFALLAATGLTADEFALLDDVRRCGYHLQLLLCERGVGQVTVPQRPSVLADPDGERAWERIRQLSPEEAWGELVGRFARPPGRAGAWPFADPPNTAAFTVSSVLEGTAEIVYVSHDEEDGAWQFLDDPDRDDGAKVVSLHRLLQLDPTLAELASLPLGWHAFRHRPGSPWRWARSARASGA
jgi:hypothetical protein